MKWKIRKILACAMLIVLMGVLVNPLTAHAGRIFGRNYNSEPADREPIIHGSTEGISIQYPANGGLVKWTELTANTANTTMAINGSLVDDFSNFDFTGATNSLNVAINNLPSTVSKLYPRGTHVYHSEQHPHDILFEFSFYLENDDTITISMGKYRDLHMDWESRGSSEHFGLTLINYPVPRHYQEGEIYDFANLYINPLFSWFNRIRSMFQSGLTEAEIRAAIETELSSTAMQLHWSYSEYYTGVPVDSFLLSRPAEECKIESGTMDIGISYFGFENSYAHYYYDEVEKYYPIFDPCYYHDNHLDLDFPSTKKMFNHFLTEGMKQGRQASAEFNVHTYIQNYPDLQAVFGDDLSAYYYHYLNTGKAEGRIAR